MRSQTAKCVIIGHKNFGETDKLVFLYNEELGKIKAVARGARKITSKFTGHLETLNFAEVQLYFGPKNTLITEITTIRSHKNLKQDLPTLNSAIQIASITDQMLMENQTIDDLTPLINETINYLNKSNKPQLIFIAYAIKLLDTAGHMPDFQALANKEQSTTRAKFIKFFNFVINNNFQEIQKISLSENETARILEIIDSIKKY